MYIGGIFQTVWSIALYILDSEALVAKAHYRSLLMISYIKSHAFCAGLVGLSQLVMPRHGEFLLGAYPV
jgi:hypothetical protein